MTAAAVDAAIGGGADAGVSSMNGHVVSETEPQSRLDARRRILQAANTHRLYLHRRLGREAPLTLLSERHIQRAVCIVRRNRLVSADTLTTAGYRAGGSPA